MRAITDRNGGQAPLLNWLGSAPNRSGIEKRQGAARPDAGHLKEG
jgi:hypothetical protein